MFIDNDDNVYFSTQDANVRNIIKTYLTEQKNYPYEITDAENYGRSLVFYYTKDVFIWASRSDWADRNSLTSFSMRDMKTGEDIGDCGIYKEAGLYKDENLLLSATIIDTGYDIKQGVCLYERGAPNFTYVDLTPELVSSETLFNDPEGRNLRANIKDVNVDKRTLVVDVYDEEKKDAEGNHPYKRSIEVSY